MSRDLRVRLRHVLAVAGGLAVFGVIFMYTGDADLWLAAQCGMGTALIVYLFAHLNDSGTSDGGV